MYFICATYTGKEDPKRMVMGDGMADGKTEIYAYTSNLSKVRGLKEKANFLYEPLTDWDIYSKHMPHIKFENPTYTDTIIL